jgi:hypothetical protein
LEANPIGIFSMDVAAVEPFGPELIFPESESFAFVLELSQRTFLELGNVINIISSKMTDQTEIWDKYLRIVLDLLKKHVLGIANIAKNREYCNYLFYF